MQSPFGALRSLRAAAESPEQAAAVDSLDALFGEGRPAYAMRTPKTRVRDATRIDDLATTFADRDIAREQRHLRRVLALWAAAEEHGPRMNARDRGMAMSVQDVLEADPTHKVVIFGHNAHVGYTPFYESFTGGVTPLAGHLRDGLGASTLSLGVVFATGSTLLDPRARDDDGGPIREHVEPPPDSQAARWIAIPHARWTLDIGAIRRDGAPAAVLDFLSAPPPGYFRNYGPARPLDASYDLIVGYRQVHAATPLRE